MEKIKKFVVTSSAAHMPSKCWGIYRRVAVVETTDGKQPKMISTHCSTVIRIVATWEKRNVGHTERCAYKRALKEAEAMAARLNQ